MKEQIIKLFEKLGNETALFKPFITENEFDKLAEEIVKLFDNTKQNEITAFIQWLEDNHSIIIHDMILQDYLRYNINN